MTPTRAKISSRNFSHYYDYKIHYFGNQNYAKLKAECLRTGKLFEDPLFRPNSQNIYYSRPMPNGISWMRPGEMVKDPKFIVNVANSDDLDQGILGNCWFIAGCSALTYVPELFHKVVPKYQTCSGSDYCGIYHFRFWIYGKWNDVVVDDYLPCWTRNKRPAFCNNKEEPNEFWAALLEKAYAKVCGSYENMEGGYVSDALIDMSGGIEENFELDNSDSPTVRTNLWNILVKSRYFKSMNGAYIKPDPYVTEDKLPNGLVKGHAYSISKTETVRYRNTQERLIRLRNPWGRIEWKGRWSDNSPEWNLLSERQRADMEFKRDQEGEFWMSFDDFYFNFDSMQFCHLTPESFSEEVTKSGKSSSSLEWNMMYEHGEWVRNKSAGGSGNGGDVRYWHNPQFLVKLVDVDLEDQENMSTMLVSIMQKHNREKKRERNGQLVEGFVQFRVYKVRKESDGENAIQTRVKLTEDQLERVGNSGNYVNKREITKRFRLEPGYYLIIPSLFEHNQEGHFLIRVFTETSPDDEDALTNNSFYQLRNDPSTSQSRPRASRFATDVTISEFTGNVNSSFNPVRVRFDNPIDNISKQDVRERAVVQLKKFFQ